MQTGDKLQTGDRLPNGAMLIAESGHVILAKFHEPQPWVTWTLIFGRYESTGAGHYFTDLYDAVDDFYRRAGIEKL